VVDGLANAIKALADGRSLGATETADAFGEVMHGDATPAQIAALLTGLRVKGETAEEIAGAAQALRRVMHRVDVESPETLVDTCGTGGGVVGTFNISTAAAFVAAGAGVRVAKHGNRSFTTKCGSADVLEALGVQIEVPAERLPGVLRDAGLMFMFAPAMHPAMRHVGPVRRELGIPTVMNIVGPLANPAGVLRQVIGVADRRRLVLLAGALRQLGAIHAVVVHGEPGMDEVSPLGPTHVAEVRGETVREWTIDPTRYGVHVANAADLGGAEPAYNAALIEDILSGGGSQGARDAVALNAAAAIYVNGAVSDFGEAIEMARAAISSGSGRATLDRLRRATKPPAAGAR
jgi:anthranilate phosphoribosyltransferase